MATEIRTNPKPDATGTHQSQYLDLSSGANPGNTPKTGSVWLMVIAMLIMMVIVGLLVLFPAVFDK